MNKRAVAQISLANAKHNYNLIKAITKAEIIPVIKANAYGHGAVVLAKLYAELGAVRFAVATCAEALELRAGGIDEDILILGPVPPLELRAAIDAHATLAVGNFDYARQISALGKHTKIHIKVETGMGRTGFSTDSTDDIKMACELRNIEPEGIFTHFADAESSRQFTELQLKRFYRVLDTLKSEGLYFRIKHCANSAATLNYTGAHFDAVRCGIALYGLYDGECALPFKPVMTFKARIACINNVSAHTAISYGCTFTAPKNMRVAVVTAGYADGVSRLLSNEGHVIINSHRARILGRVCMDMFMADVTDIPAQVGDEVIIFGNGLACAEQADICATITYELACGVSARVTREYISE